jgi:hypothetical protein
MGSTYAELRRIDMYGPMRDCRCQGRHRERVMIGRWLYGEDFYLIRNFGFKVPAQIRKQSRIPIHSGEKHSEC